MMMGGKQEKCLQSVENNGNSVLPDINGEAAVAGHWVLVRALQGD